MSKLIKEKSVYLRQNILDTSLISFVNSTKICQPPNQVYPFFHRRFMVFLRANTQLLYFSFQIFYFFFTWLDLCENEVSSALLCNIASTFIIFTYVTSISSSSTSLSSSSDELFVSAIIVITWNINHKPDQFSFPSSAVPHPIPFGVFSAAPTTPCVPWNVRRPDIWAVSGDPWPIRGPPSVDAFVQLSQTPKQLPYGSAYPLFCTASRPQCPVFLPAFKRNTVWPCK